MLEQYLIKNCSPTLASLKTANLINVPFKNYDELISSVSHWNARLSPKGVDLIVLKLCESTALIYVCRKCNLQRDLNSDGVLDFLKLYGYKSTDVDYCINRLSQRLSLSADFPHEVGVFLGYPLDDVIGFISNRGQNSKCCGCWKVYCNECEALKTFAKFKKCTKIYCKLWSQGRSIIKLTVAA